MAFDVNTDEVIKLTVKLGSLHKSSLPSAVRNTLNDAAFETKKWIPTTASRQFTTRKKSFFRAFSSVQRARGFDINTMQAVAGINPDKGSKVAEGLEKQETGGTLSGKKLIPHDKARISGSYGRSVRKKNYLSNISNISTPKNRKKGSKHILIKKGGKGTVFEIQKRARGSKLVPIYTYRNTRKTRLQPAPFMRPAAMIATKKIPAFYKNNAEFQIKKYWN